ncbi:hypothetical protein [Emergencia sp. 1XD21-10]|uniref:hypothetical protein n=1 Tax=Emergencia sp. 1XD21-10 TaxID=2304569 RepID=UPI00137944D4|nr:hypothetical protein [Emergencia sp. 1XD21-10]NCE98108.1 hypothetical protein [Emergencia sp. 1XD21-10]
MSIYDKKAKMIDAQNEQEELKQKYGMEEENVVIKETSNMGKFLIRTGAILIRVIASIVLAVLASVGIISLSYPELRSGVIETVTSAFSNLF